jgi:predicted GNAT family N-acyltransferase
VDKGIFMSSLIKTNMRDDAFAARRAVSMDEQGYENEFDGIDDHPSCVHVTLYTNGDLAGCSRLFPELLERALAPESP